MPKAKFEGIYRSIKQKIEAQDYPYQSLLPAESELIQEYGCARNTLRRALADLTAAGYLQPIQGKGVRVIYRPAGKASFLIGVIESFRETDERNNLHAVTKVVRFEQVEADERLASQSGFMVGEPLWAIERVRYLEGKALILEIHRKGAAHPHRHHQAPGHGGARHHPGRGPAGPGRLRQRRGGVQRDLQRRRAAVRVHPVPPPAGVLQL